MTNAWSDLEAGSSEIENLVSLSNLIGSDGSLVQPGGGNTSVKLEETDIFGCDARALVVKGSGTDLRTILPAGFTHLYLDRLAALRAKQSLSDEEMMQVMRACMLYPDRDPLPSVETPLHSLLPFKFIAHTHDVATLCLTDTPSAEEHVSRLYGPQVAFLEYVRPGFPLARRLAERYGGGPPAGAIGLVMEKHGLAVWGQTAGECYASLRAVIAKADAYVAERGRGKRVLGPRVAPALEPEDRRSLAAALMPVMRGELDRFDWRAVLHFDDAPETLDMIGSEAFPEVAAAGVMTPEHILRAGVRPLVMRLDVGRDAESLKAQVREEMRGCRERYLAYLSANGRAEPIPDFLKTIVIPGLGAVFAGKDERNATVAAECYRATLQAQVGAEAVERFAFLSDADACEMEYWPLERRKIEEGLKARRELDGKVALIIGAASGIGRATAMRFAQEGAHVVLADLHAPDATAAAGEIESAHPSRASAVAVDVAEPSSVSAAFRDAMLQFGGIDVLFYSPGVAPGLQSVVEMSDAEIRRQMQVHFEGAVAATREAARVMLDQGSGGRLIYNASKAAYVPGEGAAAYGASKAALVHYVRNVANELGRHGITANYVNADAVDTPLFRSIMLQRARQQGRTEEEMLGRYAERSVLREALVPPEAVAESALWLASDRSAHTTGCVITVGGGYEGFPR